MITLPITWSMSAVLTVLALVVQTTTVAVTTMVIYRWYSRTERAALSVREDVVTVRENEVSKERRALVEERLELERQNEDLRLRELDLGQRAHDVDTQAKALMHEMSVEDDTTVLMSKEELL